MRRALVLMAGVAALWSVWTSDALAQTRLGARDAPIADASSVVPSIRFIGTPKWRRVRGDSRVPETIAITARVQVADSRTSRPIANVPVTVSAYSGGAASSALALTDLFGKAETVMTFEDVPPGGLHATLVAWLRGDSSIATEEVAVSLRDFVSLDVATELTWVLAPADTQVQQATPFSVDHVVSSMLTARLEVNLIEVLRNWRYSNVSVYGSIPAMVTYRMLCCDDDYAAFSLGTLVGFGDYSTGISGNWGGILFGDVSLNGRNGRISLIEPHRRLGYSEPTAIADALQSVNLAVQAAVPVSQSRRRFLLAGGSLSRARPSLFSNGDRLERDDWLQATAGVGFRGRRVVTLLSVSHAEYGSTRLIRSRSAGVPSSVRTATPAIVMAQSRESLFAVTLLPSGSRRASVGGALVVGGFGAAKKYFAATLRLQFGIL